MIHYTPYILYRKERGRMRQLCQAYDIGNIPEWYDFFKGNVSDKYIFDCELGKFYEFTEFVRIRRIKLWKIIPKP